MNFQSYILAKTIKTIEQLIEDNRERESGTSVIDTICYNGDLHLLMFINENPELFNLEWGSSNMKNAVESGNLELVIWLHENRTEGCTTDAMDSAASTGRLHMVKWLNENRKEGCSAEAIYEAATDGHLDILEYIISNIKVEFSYDEAIACADSMHFDNVVKWLEKMKMKSVNEC